MQNDSGIRTFVAGEALLANRLVKLSGANTVTLCGPGETAIGVTRNAVASGSTVTVFLLSKPGTLPCAANGVVAVNALVYPASSGLAGTTGSGQAIGRALNATTTSGELFEVMPLLTPSVGDRTNAVELFSDFFQYATSGPFTVTADAGSTGGQALVDGVGGVMAVYTDGDDNDEAYLHSVVEGFKFAADKPLYFEARVAITEGATNAAAVIIGLMDAAGADALQDTEAGPKASYSGACFFKVAGTLVLSAEASVGATQVAASGGTADTGHTSGTFRKYGIEFLPTSSTAATVNFYIDGVRVGSSSITFTGATEMDAIVGAKSNGSAEELVSVDYVLVRQVR